MILDDPDDDPAELARRLFEQMAGSPGMQEINTKMQRLAQTAADAMSPSLKAISERMAGFTPTIDPKVFESMHAAMANMIDSAKLQELAAQMSASLPKMQATFGLEVTDTMNLTDSVTIELIRGADRAPASDRVALSPLEFSLLFAGLFSTVLDLLKANAKEATESALITAALLFIVILLNLDRRHD